MDYFTNESHFLDGKLLFRMHIVRFKRSDYQIRLWRWESNDACELNSSPGQTLLDMVKVHDKKNSLKVKIAVNGGFFRLASRAPSGILQINDEVIKHSRIPFKPDTDLAPSGILCIDREGHAYVRALPEDRSVNLSNLKCRDDFVWINEMPSILESGPMLIRENQMVVFDSETASEPFRRALRQRSAIGSNEATDEIVIAVVENGPCEFSGMSLYELGKHMRELGCSNALNLDGGGSATIYYDSNGRAVLFPRNDLQRKISNAVLVVPKNLKLDRSAVTQL